MIEVRPCIGESQRKEGLYDKRQIKKQVLVPLILGAAIGLVCCQLKKKGGEAHPVPVILSPKGVEMFRVNHFGCVTSVFAVAVSQFICIFAHC